MSEDPITPQTFEHLAALAALELDERQAEYLRRELNRQLGAINELAAIPLDEDTAVTSHGVPYPPEIRPQLRADAWQPWSDPDAILAQAPETEQRYIVVPDIPHTTLE